MKKIGFNDNIEVESMYISECPTCFKKFLGQQIILFNNKPWHNVKTHTDSSFNHRKKKDSYSNKSKNNILHAN